MPTYTLSTPRYHDGAGDGSAAIAVGDQHFIAANDEEDTLRLYSITPGNHLAKPLLHLDAWPAFQSGPGQKKKHEADIEGAARIGDVIYWITSHSRDRHAEQRQDRCLIFATTVHGQDAETQLQPLGTPYQHLLAQIRNGPASWQPLWDAIDRNVLPKENGGFNIESLCPAPDGALYIGLRNPIPDGLAVILPLLNPYEIVTTATPALLGDLIHLDLGGLGIRDMKPWQGGYLILAGSHASRDGTAATIPRLYQWDGLPSSTPTDLKVDFHDLNPEAVLLFGPPPTARALILSDDGKNPPFRSVWLEEETPQSR